ncbi:MAG: hypothetical protein WAX29_10245, partial [Propionibacterium sp.]
MCAELPPVSPAAATPGGAELLLDADAARTCPVKTHNRFDATVTLPATVDARHPGRPELTPVDEFVPDTAGARGRLLDSLARWPGAVDLRALAGRPAADREAATAQAVG